MRTKGEAMWEHVSSIVDRQINTQHFHIWPFPHSLPVDVRFLILDRHRDVPMHRPDHLEVVVLESGEMGYEFEDRTCRLGKDDILVAGDRIGHRCVRLGNFRHNARSVVLSFLPNLVHSGAPLSDDVQYLMPFMLLGPSFPNVIPADTGIARETRDFIERIRRELTSASERSRLAIKTYLKMVLLALVNYYSELNATREAILLQQSNLRRLAPLLDHVEQHYHEPIRVIDAARLCAMSECYFMHLFKELTGQSFVSYLNWFRVSRAQHLLASTEKPIVDISLETGFCNQSYFGVVFRRLTGMTPLKYRLQNGIGPLRGQSDSVRTTMSSLQLPPCLPSSDGSFPS
jgi:AraC-like DNA-binding protein